MTVAVTLESRLLARINRELDAAVARLGADNHTSARLDILEGVAAELGGIDLERLRQALPAKRLPVDAIAGPARILAGGVAELPMPAPVAIASIAQPALDGVDRRRAGAYYTDFRLARYVAEVVAPRVPRSGAILDPACGSGTLLAAVAQVLIAEGSPPPVVLDRIAGADLSPGALRSCLTTLAAFTSDADTVARLATRLVSGDSLTAGDEVWASVNAAGIAAVITNPPWEKLKLSRHELLQRAGVLRHYGDGYRDGDLDAVAVGEERSRLHKYTVSLDGRFAHQGPGEDDLFKLFVELAYRLVKPGGAVGLIVPAGLIRSRGASALRRLLLAKSATLELTVLENRARFFPIDTRFKFVVLGATIGEPNSEPLVLLHASGTHDGVQERGRAEVPRAALRQLRPDLSVPEVRDEAEWDLFARMSHAGLPLDGSDLHWRMDIAREVDMTNDSASFLTQPDVWSVPLIEGRMVHQFRCGAKQYESGTGRRAVWRVVPLGRPMTRPQFWIPLDALPLAVRARVERRRIGFCDVTGQTNERSMLASAIPAGVVCGNKVPTVVLDVAPEHDDDASALWLSIANSFAFDWLLRRVVTTTVNFFVLRSLVFPPIWISDSAGQRLIELAKCLLSDGQDRSALDAQAFATYRAAMDAEVAAAWLLSQDDIDLMLSDFPLLDREQPALPGEHRSTVTADLFRLAFAERTGGDRSERARLLRERVGAARQLGATGYAPSEHVADLRRQATRGRHE